MIVPGGMQLDRCARLGCHGPDAKSILVYVAGGMVPFRLKVCAVHYVKHANTNLSASQFRRAFGVIGRCAA